MGMGVHHAFCVRALFSKFHPSTSMGWQEVEQPIQLLSQAGMIRINGKRLKANLQVVASRVCSRECSSHF